MEGMMNENITASYLFAKEKYLLGDEKCFYCGISCGQEYNKKDFVKPTFTNRDIVKNPGSDYVCGCCVDSMRTGGDDLILIDGDIKAARSATPRMYSWILSQSGNKAFSKRHLDFARSIIVDPPNPPFSIILADSGQKQLIFRAPVNYDKKSFVVLLEEKEISVFPYTIKKYLEIAVLVSAACGKKSLTDPDQFNNWKNVIEMYRSEIPLVEWIKIYLSPMGELAAWLCPGKEEALNGDFVSGRLQKETCGNSGQEVKNTGNGENNSQGRSNQILFDFA
jgi:hypothetical protein